MKKFLLLNLQLVVILLVANQIVFAQSPGTLISTSPVTNSQNAALNANVSVTYNDNMIAPSASNTAMRLFGNKRGAFSYTGGGTYSGVNTSTITYNPTRNFLAGELLSIINNSNMDNGVINSRPTNSYFWAASGAATAQFTSSTNSSFSYLSQDRDFIEIKNADLDLDGDLDIVFSFLDASGRPSLGKMLNNGTGSFSSFTTLYIGTFDLDNGTEVVRDFDLGDVNHDGDVDVVLSVSGSIFSALYVFSNNGLASFSSSASTYSGVEYDVVKLVDVDADGNLDLVGLDRTAGIIASRSNNGAGAFTGNPVTIFSLLGVYNFVAGDFNGDRRMDFASTRNNGFIRLSIQQTTANTYVTTAYNTNTTISLEKIKILDLEGDGDLDVAALNLNDDVVVFMLNAAGVLSTPSTVAATGISNFDLADYDGDGDFDLGFSAGNNSLQVYKNTAGTFTSFSNISLGTGAINNIDHMCSGDYDGDGDIDVIGKFPVQVVTLGYPIKLLRNSNLTITPGTVAGPFCTGAAFNVTYTANGGFNTGNIFSVQISDASGSFASPITIGSISSTSLTGTIPCSVPGYFTTGSGYKIRVVSSNVSFIGAESNVFTINALPVVALASRACNSTNTTAITVSGATTYTWSPALGLNNTNTASVIANPSAPTIYTVIGVTNGCSDTATVSVSNSCYCVGNYTVACSSNDFIESVEMNNIDNTGTGCNGNLGNYIAHPATGNLTTTLQAGNSYDLFLTTGTFAQGFGVWIDYNRDNDFDDAGEFVYSVSPTSSVGATITLPSSVVEGQSVMRVRSIYNTTPTSADVCNNHTYGETEDYIVTLVNPLTVISTVPIENTTTSATNSNVVVNFSTPVSSSSIFGILLNPRPRFHGQFKGLYNNNNASFTFSGAGTASCTYNLTQDFNPGERIVASLPAANGVNGSTLASPYQFEFTTAAGSGTARFQALTSVVSGNISDVVAGDFNNDGDVDYAVTRPSLDEFATTLQVYNNNGAGTFTSSSAFSTYYDISIAAGDMDNDGDLDLVTAVPFGSNQMDFYTNDGTGSFTFINSTWTTEAATNVELADMDGDGDLDIVCSNPTSGRLFYYVNTGSGPFSTRFTQTPILIQTLASINSFTIGDFNKDGLLDVASGRTSSGFIRINYNTLTNPGTFQAAVSAFTGSTAVECGSLKSFDFDSDGDLDIASTKATDGTVIIVRNNYPSTGAGSYALAQTLTVNAAPQRIEAADFDGDLDIDLYVAHSAATAVYISNNAGTFAVTTNATGGSPSVICSADFDEDGDIDIVGKSGVVITATPITFIQNQEYTVTAVANTNPACAGSFMSIGRTLSPTTWPSTTFTAELSNAAGSFATPVTLGSVTTTIGFSSSFLIPANTPAGSGYRIRWINNLTGSTVVQSGTFTINTISVFNVTGGGSICSNTNATINLSGSTSGVKYRLIRNSVIYADSINGTGSPIAFTTNVAGTYTIQAIHLTTGCSAFMNGSVVVTVNPAPTVFTSFGGGSYCAGGAGVTITLNNSTSGVTYELLLAGVPTGISINSTGGPLTFMNVLAAGTYTIRATNNVTGCTAIMNNSPVVTVIPAVVPSVTIGTVSNPTCAGTAVNFTANPVNGGTPTYTWFVNAVNAGASSTSGTFSSSSLVNGDVVTVSMSSSVACASPNPATANVTMTVNPNVTPTITINTAQTTICAGASVTFTSGITNGGASPQYQWQINGANVGGATSSTFTTSTLTNGQSVRCRLTSNANCASPTQVFSSVITMTVNSVVTPTVNINTATPNVCAGQSVTFTSNITNGGTSPQYQWQINGANVGGATSSTFTTTALVGSDQVRVRLTSNATCASPTVVFSSPFVMNVSPVVVPSISISPASNPICSNDGAFTTFTASLTNGGSEPEVSWFVNGVLQSTGTNNEIFSSYLYSNGDQVTAQLSSNALCASPSNVNSNSVTMVVNTASVPTITEIVAGTLQSSVAVSYQWYLNGNPIGGATNQTYVYSSVGNYTVEITDANGCIELSNAYSIGVPTITVTPVSGPFCPGANFNITYSTSSNFIAGNVFTAQLSGAGGGFGSPVTIGTVTAISSGIINVTIPGGTPSGTGYRIRVIASNPVASSTPTPSFTINAITTAGVTIVSNPSGAQCAGTNILFTATPVNGGSLPQYQWRINGSPVIGANSVTFNTNTLNNNDVVTVTLTSNLACVTGSPITSLGITQIINPTLTPTVTISGSTSGCVGDLATYTSVISNGGAGPVYQWKINGTNVPLANSSTFSTSSLNNNDVVSLQLTSNALCASPTIVQSNNINYTLNALPIAYNLSGGGVLCPSASSININLDGSQTGVNYQLLNGISPVGLPLAGTGNPISFAVSGAGTYTVVATSTASCSNDMSGIVNVTVDPIPTQYTLTGTSPICVGDVSEILISDSQSGFNYQLLYNGNPVGSLEAGTGAAISFGFYQDAGTYSVQITNISSLCQTALLSTFNLNYSPSPTVFNLSGPSSICPGEDATYTLSGSQSGTSYSLLLNGISVQNLAGTGAALAFNPVSTQGTYTIDAQLGSCVATMNDTINLIEFLPPVSYTLSGPAFLCENGTGVVNLSGSESGVVYDLFNDFGYTGQTIVGTGAALDYSINVASFYEVFATTSNGCTASVGFLNIPAATAITAYNLIGGGTICSGDLGETIALDGSETGVDYYVYLNSAAYDGPIAGTNLPLTLGTYTDPGNYTVIAIDNLFSCEVDMLGTAIINVVPGIPSANAGSDQNICNNNTTMSANNAGVGNTGTWTVLSGTGVFVNANNPITTVNNIGFGSNTYIWTITNGTCAPKRDTVQVFRNTLPTVFNMQGGGLFCAGAAGVNVGLSGSQLGVDYVLSANGLPIANLNGTNASLNFGLQIISGNYTISATDTVTGCSANMNGVTVVNELPIPPAPIVTVVNNCGSSEITATGISGTLLWNDGSSINPRTETSGTYTATQDVAGCISAASAAVTANPLTIPVTLPNSANTTPPCNAAGINYSVTLTTGSSYAWTVPFGSSIVSGAVGPNNNSITVNFGNLDGDITVTETNADGCVGSPVVYSINLQGCNLVADFVANITTICEGGAVTYSDLSSGITTGAIYDWNFGTGASPATAAGAGPHTVNYNTPGLVTVSLTITEGASVTETKTDYIVVNPTPSAPAVSVTNNCGNSLITASSYTGNLLWNDGSSINPRTETSGTYNATQEIAGCVSAVSNTVTANPLSFPSTSTITGNTTPACFANSQVYTVSLTSGSSYAWTVPAGAVIISGATGPNNNSITVNFGNNNGNITVLETAANGCVGSTQTLPISLTGCGVVIDFNANNTSVCAGQTLTFTSAVTGTIGATDLNWDFGVGATPSTVTGNGPHVVTYNTAGFVSVTLTLTGDVNGTLTKPNYIDVNPQITDLTITSINETCGANNGVIQITGVIGGEATFNYEINGGGLTPSNLYSNLNSGTYLVAVSDVNGCTYSENVILNSIDGPSAITTSIVDATCASSNGSIDVTSVTGGTSGYSYSLDGSAYVGSTLFNGLVAGAYTVFVRDANNCVFSQGFNINNTGGVTDITTNINNATCGNSNGAITVDAVTGGTPGYLYNIDGGLFNTTSSFFGLTGGNYTIGVQDANGCVYTELVNVNSLAGPSSLSFNITDETCNQANGAVDVNFVLGGGALFSVTFNGISSLNTNYTGLSVGNYFVTVLDANGCSISTTATVNSTPAITSITTSINDATCGSSNGSIDVTGVTGGTAGYSYSLDGSVYVGTTLFSGLASGAYTIFVQDANNCIFSQGFNINNTGGVTSITTSITDATCGSSNGSIDVTGVTGGTAGYSYSLDGSVYVGTTLFSGLASGAYTIFVQDANNCIFSQGFNINNTGGVTSITTSITDATCGSSNGSIDVTGVSGGTPGYSYSLDGSAFVGTTLFSGLASGAYTMFVKDANNCVFSQGFNINSTGGPTAVTTTTINENCGNADGSVNITGVTDGVGPYSYNFNGLGFSSNTNYTALAAGTYTLIVEDVNLCTFSTTVTLGNNAGPTAFSVLVTNANCGSSDGEILINSVTGGTAPYTYSNDGGSFSSSNLISGLNAGLYAIYVQDDNGCQYNELVTVGNVGSLTVDLFPVDETCGLSNGYIQSIISGGTSPYDILWSNSDTVQDIFSLSAGVYSITVTDAFGCVGLANATILNSSITLSAIVTDANCGNNSGAIDLTVLTGGGSYTYTWNNGDLNEDIDSLFAGNYDVIVNDYNGCSANASFTVGDTPGITNFTTTTNDATCGSNNGSIEVSVVTGGITPYEYYIDGVSQSNNNIFANLGAGSYLIKVQDNAGCEYDSTIVVNTTASITSVNTNVQDETCGELNGSVTILSVVGGVAPYTYSFNGSPFSFQTFYTGLNNGIYNYEVIDDLGCNFIGSLTVASIGAVTSINTTIIDETCGNANGSIEITASFGGTPPYEYALNSGPYSNSPIFTGLVAANDTIYVKDNIGCIFQQIVTVGGTPAANAFAGSDIVVCENTNVTLTASGGVSYTWDNGLGNTSVVNFIASTTTNYVVEVQDANGCIDTDTVTVTVNTLPATPTITASGPTTFCFGNSVDLTSSYIGGNSWSTTATTDLININAVGVYSIDVTYTDGNGCSSTSAPINVTVNALPATPIITASGPTTFCFGNNVDLTSSYVGGNTWSTTATTDLITINAVGVYAIDVTQTDGNGCSATSAPINVTVNALPATPIITASGPTTFCFGNSVDLTSSYIGGNTWSNAATTDFINVNAVGVYAIDVTHIDANGCSATSAAINVTVNALPVTPIITASGPTTFCFGNSVDLTSSYIGGNTWSTTATTDLISINAVGVYAIDVTQTDGNGCSSTSAPVNVTVNALPATPIITASGPTTFCFGNSVDLTSSYIGGNTWSNAATTDLININAVGVYSIDVTYTDGNGCSATSAPINVTVNALPAIPIITASGPTTFCFGNSVDLTSSYVGGNTWSNAATTDLININAVGVYSIDVTQTDGNGCSSTSAPINVTVNALPATPIIAASGPTTFCFGNSVDLTSSYIGGNTWSNAATTDFINVNAVGVYAIDVTHTDANGCSSTSATINITVNALPAQPVITAFGSLVICDGTSVTLASNEPNGNIWSNSENTQSIDVSVAGNYTVTYTDGNACSQTSDAVEVVVNTPVPATLNLPNTVSCEGGAAVILSGGTPVGGNYIGAGVINNILYPTLLPGGNYAIDYVVNDINGCTAVATQNYTINAAPVVTASATQTVVCLNDVPASLTGSPLGGVFTGNGVVGTSFDPSLAGAGIHAISYQYTDINGCSATTSFDIIVNPLPQLTLLPVVSLCVNSGTFGLNNGFPTGGTYLIDGVLATEINTNTLSVGAHTLTYNYSPANGCGNSISTQFTINPLPLVSLPVFADICESASPLILTGGLPSAGNYSGSGVLGGVFYPNLANSNNIITFSYTDANGCNATASQNITVLTPQAINFAPISPVCLNSTAIALNTANPVGGIYSGVGVISNTFDPAIAGVGVHIIQYDFTDVNGCISNSNQTITVNALPVLSSVAMPAICGNDNAFALAFAQPVGGVYSGTGINNNMFDPSLAGNGTFNLLYVFTDNNSCVDTISENITVNAAPVVTQTNYAATCGNAGLITLNNGLPAGGVYTGNFVSNGLFNSDLSGAGTFAIDYTFTDVNGCSGTAFADIVVNSLPSASLSSLGNICAGAGNIILNNGLPLGGTYYGAGVTTGILDPTVLPNGTQTLGYTYTDGNGCVDSVSISYNIYTLQANAGIDQSITCTTSALLQGQSNYSGIGALSYTWSPSLGLSSTTTQNTVATPSSSTNYVLTVSDGTCSSDDTVLVLVSQPNFNLAVTPSAQILNTAPFIVFFTNNTPSPSNYSFVWDFGDGTTYNGFQPIYHNYTSNGTFTVTLIATALGSGCIDTLAMSNLITCNNGIFCNDSANIYIDGLLIPNNSNYSTTICANQNFLLGCNTGADYSYQWYFNGIPLQSALGSTYAPTVTGYYTVGVEDSSCINLSSPVYITVLPLPSTPLITSTGSNNFCGGGSLTLTANTGYTSYLWSTGSTQNSITINASGNYWVQGFDANGCYAQSLDFAVNGSNMLPQYICVSTVDTLLNKNKIIWEKPITTSIDSFVVYRESVLAGVYNEIGRVAYNDNSEFVDTTSLPDVNNNRYRLAIKDSCGNMTTQGDIHGTIKATITPLGNGDSLEVFFTKYIGIDSLSYTLYRGPSVNAMSPASSAFYFNNNANIYSIKDLSPPAYPSGYVYYQVRANLENLCNSDSNVYQQSISNTIGYGNALGIGQSGQLFEVNAFPNPNNGAFNINIETSVAEDLNLVIYDQVGAVVWRKQIEKLNGKTTIFVPLEQAAQGVYQLQVTSNRKVVNKRLIINK